MLDHGPLNNARPGQSQSAGATGDSAQNGHAGLTNPAAGAWKIVRSQPEGPPFRTLNAWNLELGYTVPNGAVPACC